MSHPMNGMLLTKDLMGAITVFAATLQSTLIPSSGISTGRPSRLSPPPYVVHWLGAFPASSQLLSTAVAYFGASANSVPLAPGLFVAGDIVALIGTPMREVFQSLYFVPMYVPVAAPAHGAPYDTTSSNVDIGGIKLVITSS